MAGIPHDEEPATSRADQTQVRTTCPGSGFTFGRRRRYPGIALIGVVLLAMFVWSPVRPPPLGKGALKSASERRRFE
jgi:hypothetical protein